MAVASTMFNARCLNCGHTYYDPNQDQPCPRCDSEQITALGAGPSHQATPAKAAPPQSAPAKVAAVGPVIGLFAVLFGIPAWLEGARTTRDGWVFGLNWIADRAGIPFQIPDSSAWHWAARLGIMVALGWAYSRVELHWTPIRPPKNLRRDFFDPTAWYVNRVPAVWLIWALVLFTDVVTMFLGARQATASDPVLLQQIAASVTRSWIYAILITFIPDRLLRLGWRSIRRY